MPAEEIEPRDVADHQERGDAAQNPGDIAGQHLADAAERAHGAVQEKETGTDDKEPEQDDHRGRVAHDIVETLDALRHLAGVSISLCPSAVHGIKGPGEELPRQMEDKHQAHRGEQGAYEPAHPGKIRHTRAVRSHGGMGDTIKEGHTADNEFQKSHSYEIINHYLPVLAFVPVLTKLPAKGLSAIVLLRISSGSAGLLRSGIFGILGIHNNPVSPPLKKSL